VSDQGIEIGVGGAVESHGGLLLLMPSTPLTTDTATG